ncbi:MAG: lipid-binding SYLF domain-containing protein [Desulfomonilaceae bacterium]
MMLFSQAHASDLDELNSRISQCEYVLKQSLEMPDSRIPKDLLQRCRALAIFPKVFNLGAFVGISFGLGIVLRRDEITGQWSYPVFFSIKQGSLGMQVGAQSIDLIFLMMSEKTIQKLLEEKLTLGLDVSVSAGPVGREAAAETNWSWESGILSYSRSKGLFMGVSISGSILEPDRKSNEIYHGPDISVQDALYENRGALSDSAKSLINTLDQATKF